MLSFKSFGFRDSERRSRHLCCDYAVCLILWLRKLSNGSPAKVKKINNVIYVFMIIYVFIARLQLSKGEKNADNNNFLSPQRRLTEVVACADRFSPRHDSCWSWVVCFAGVVSNVVICGFTYSYGILFPALLEEFKEGKANTGEVVNNMSRTVLPHFLQKTCQTH